MSLSLKILMEKFNKNFDIIIVFLCIISLIISVILNLGSVSVVLTFIIMIVLGFYWNFIYKPKYSSNIAILSQSLLYGIIWFILIGFATSLVAVFVNQELLQSLIYIIVIGLLIIGRILSSKDQMFFTSLLEIRKSILENKYAILLILIPVISLLIISTLFPVQQPNSVEFINLNNQREITINTSITLAYEIINNNQYTISGMILTNITNPITTRTIIIAPNSISTTNFTFVPQQLGKIVVITTAKINSANLINIASFLVTS